MVTSATEEGTSVAGTCTELISQITKLLQTSRKIDSNELLQQVSTSTKERPTLSTAFDAINSSLKYLGRSAEVDALQSAYEKVTEQKEYGGLAISADQTALDPTSFEAVLFQVEAYLTALSKKEASRQTLPVISTPAPGTKPMTIAEKIFAHHAVGEIPPQGLSAGDVIRVGLDWVLASELSWDVSDPGVRLKRVTDRF